MPCKGYGYEKGIDDNGAVGRVCGRGGENNMTISFQSDIRNNAIEIPEQCRGNLPTRVFVTITAIGAASARHRRKELSPPHIDTTGWKFDRTEANER
jgi:hypothetical protein